MKSGIYYIQNICNGKIYIGSAVAIIERWRVHKHLLRQGKHYNRHLQSAWDKDGEDSFVFGIVEVTGNKDDLLGMEQRWINHYKSFNDKNGYNILPIAGSRLGTKHSKETRKKLSESHKGQRPWMKGKKHSEETRKKISLAVNTDRARKIKTQKQKGRKRTAETKAKISDALRNRVHTEKSKEKQRAIMTGKKLGESHRQNCIEAWKVRKLKNKQNGG